MTLHLVAAGLAQVVAAATLGARKARAFVARARPPFRSHCSYNEDHPAKKTTSSVIKIATEYRRYRRHGTTSSETNMDEDGEH